METLRIKHLPRNLALLCYSTLISLTITTGILLENVSDIRFSSLIILSCYAVQFLNFAHIDSLTRLDLKDRIIDTSGNNVLVEAINRHVNITNLRFAPVSGFASKISLQKLQTLTLFTEYCPVLEGIQKFTTLKSININSKNTDPENLFPLIPLFQKKGRSLCVKLSDVVGFINIAYCCEMKFETLRFKSQYITKIPVIVWTNIILPEIKEKLILERFASHGVPQNLPQLCIITRGSANLKFMESFHKQNKKIVFRNSL